MQTEAEKRAAILAHCHKMNGEGLNQGSSGNISMRHGGGMLITPSGMPYDVMTPGDIVVVDADGAATGGKPSSEWQFHLAILQNRPEVNAVFHAHPTYCTTLAIHGRDIPAVHYMVAVFGGNSVRCAPYAIYGSAELSDYAVEALKNRKACLLAHHGLITAGTSLEQAYWLAGEAEALAQQYHAALLIGDPPILSDAQIEAVLQKFDGYGLA